jgi:hypothetical protein
MTRPGCTWASTIGAMLLAMGAVAAEPASVWIWYRTSDGCPDGESFVTRLNVLGQSARLAGVGDRVDFVVTLGHERDTSSGRLERQTRSGTVAIREYRDADCAQVAEALALTLDLALEPNDPPPDVRRASADGASALDRAVRSDEPRPNGAPPRDSSEAPLANVALGAQATLATGVAPEPLPGAALFLELGSSDWLPRSSRLTLLGGYSESTAGARQLDVTLLGVRAEACPLRWSVSTALLLEPCAGAEAGLIRGEGADPAGTADTGFWSSVLAQGRVAIGVGGPLWLEAQVGGRVPLVRYEMGTRDGSADWFRTGAVGLEAGVGASWQIR